MGRVRGKSGNFSPLCPSMPLPKMADGRESSESSADEDDVRLRPRYLSRLRSSRHVEVVDITSNVGTGNPESADVQRQNGESPTSSDLVEHPNNDDRGKAETVKSSPSGVSLNMDESNLQVLINKIKSIPYQHHLSKEISIALKLINENLVARDMKDCHSVLSENVSACEESQIISEESQVCVPSLEQEEDNPVKVFRDCSAQTTISGDVLPRDINNMLDVIQTMINDVKTVKIQENS